MLFRSQDLADAALQSQPTVAKTAVGRPSRSFGAKVKQPTRAISKLREKKAPAVADIGIIDMELMTMISERQRFFERICQWLELAKMRYPLFAGQSAKTHRLSPAIIAKMQDRSREIRRGDWVAYFLPQGKNGGRTEEHTSELQSLMRNSYAVFC